MLSLHEHNEEHSAQRVAGLLEGGARVALCSDAGTPLVSDPGYRTLRLVVHARRDDYRTQPSGNSGDRIACGVVTGS